MKANDLHNFVFERHGYGCYKVTYCTEKRGDYYVGYINDMTIIDNTLNAEWAKTKDIKYLHYMVIQNGAHYNKRGKRI